jgi:NACalpha-BTF3-like transcription factor
MSPEQKADKLDAELKDQDIELVKLQGNVAKNKEASKELQKSLENLEAATKKLEKEQG